MNRGPHISPTPEDAGSVGADSRHSHAGKGPSRLVYGIVFVLLLALLALTVAMAHVHLGRFNATVAMSIAIAKAALVGCYFMHARYTGALIRFVAAGATVWLTILIALTLSDYLTRG